MAETKDGIDQAPEKLTRLQATTTEDLRRAWKTGVESGPSTPVRKGDAKQRLRRLNDEAKS